MTYQKVTDYLTDRNITHKTSSDKNEAIICCLFCEDTKYHLYINNPGGYFWCHKCGAKGSWKNLVERLGDNSSPQLEGASSIVYTAELQTSVFNPELITKYQNNIPDRIKAYLKDERGLTDETINLVQIGWDGKSIAFPVPDAKGRIINIRHRRDPQKQDGPKLWNEKGGKASLFNIRSLDSSNNPTNMVIITEGEFDAMIASQNGFPAVSSTAGAATFKEEWVQLFRNIEQIYVCYDTDQAGEEGSKKVATLFNGKAKVVKLPSNGEAKVDITDYFVKLKHAADDFQKLLDQAKVPETSTTDFELLDTHSQITLHPSLDFYQHELYITLPLPIRLDKKEGTKLVTLSSSKQKAVVEQNKIKIGNQILALRKVTAVPGHELRWQPEDIQNFLTSQDHLSSALPFIELRQTLLRFVDFRKETDADILALWLLGTYCFPIFDAFPYVYLVGVKRSGKTKTLLLIERLAFNAILSSNISPAVLFRLVEAKRCTLALDEGEQLADRDKKEELRELLNSGYKRGAPAYRVKKSKGEFEIEAFEVYGPKAIANISGLDNVLEDRAITITMVRTDNPSKGNLAVTEASENWSYLRSLLYSFALTYAETISTTYHTDPEVNTLLNRQNELWRPLLSIAKVIDKESPGTFTRLREEAILRAEDASSADLEDFDSAVLLALRNLVYADVDTTLTNKEIRDKACEFLEEDQKIYFTSRGVGAALKRFGIKGKKIQGNWRYSTNKATIKDLLKRYGMDDEWI